MDLELVADAFSFPTSVVCDGNEVYIAESGLAIDGAVPGGRVSRLDRNGARSLVAEGLKAPVTGLAFHDGRLYVSEGGHPGRISCIDASRRHTVILDGLPGPGNYHVNMATVGPDKKLYFSQGAMTNTGVVGLDGFRLAWLRQVPHAWDRPAWDVVLTGSNFDTDDPRSAPNAIAHTGAFVPFGVATARGQRIRGTLPCTAALMRCDIDGRNLELVAWGLRNAFGIGFLADGRLIAIDQGADERGSRPVANAPDLLYEVRVGAWYGWPDFVGGEPINSRAFAPADGHPPPFLLANHRDLPTPERPLLRFPPHAGAVKFDVLSAATPWPGHLLVALFGDEKPMTAPAGARVGRAVVRIDPSDWTVHAFPVDGLERPIDVRVDRRDGAIYVLDFGRFEMDDRGRATGQDGSGRLWRVRV